MDVRARRRMMIRQREIRRGRQSPGGFAEESNHYYSSDDDSSIGEKENINGATSPVTTRSRSPFGARIRIGGSQRSSFQQFSETYEREESPVPLRETSHCYQNPSNNSEANLPLGSFGKKGDGFNLENVFKTDLDEELAELPSLSISEEPPSLSVSISDELPRLTLSNGSLTEEQKDKLSPTLSVESKERDAEKDEPTTTTSSSSPSSRFDERERRRKQERERIMRLMNGLDELLVETPTNEKKKTFTLQEEPKSAKDDITQADNAKTEEERMKIRSLMQGLDLLLVDTPPSSAKEEAFFKEKTSNNNDKKHDEGRAVPRLESVTSEQTTVLAGITAKHCVDDVTSPSAPKSPYHSAQYTIDESSEDTISTSSSCLEENFMSMISARSSEDQDNFVDDQNQRVVKDPSGVFLNKKPCPSGVKPSSSSGTMNHNIGMSHTSDIHPSTSQSSFRSQSTSYTSSAGQEKGDDEALQAFRSRRKTSYGSSNGQIDQSQDQTSCTKETPEESSHKNSGQSEYGPRDSQETYNYQSNGYGEEEKAVEKNSDDNAGFRSTAAAPQQQNLVPSRSRTPTIGQDHSEISAHHSNCRNGEDVMKHENAYYQDEDVNQHCIAEHAPSQVPPKPKPMNRQSSVDTEFTKKASNLGSMPSDGQAYQNQYDDIQQRVDGTESSYYHEQIQLRRAGSTLKGTSQQRQQQWTYPNEGQSNAHYDKNGHEQYRMAPPLDKQTKQRPYSSQARTEPHRPMQIMPTGSAPVPQSSEQHQNEGQSHRRANSATPTHFRENVGRNYHSGNTMYSLHQVEQKVHGSLPPLQPQAPRQQTPSQPTSPTTNYYHNMMEGSQFGSRPAHSMTPQPYNRHAASLEVRSIRTAPSQTQPPLARKVLARSLESQEAQNHTGKATYDMNSASTPLAKTKHSRYHRGGKFREDQQFTKVSSPPPKFRTLEEKVEEMKAQQWQQSEMKNSSPQEGDDVTVATTTFTEATTAVTAGTPDRGYKRTETFSSCESSDESDMEYEEENIGTAFLHNAMGIIENIAIPSFTNCVTTTKGVYDQVQARAERACITGQPGRRKKKGKKKRDKQRRKSTSAISTSALVRSSEKMMYMCSDAEPRPIKKKDSKTGLPYF